MTVTAWAVTVASTMLGVAAGTLFAHARYGMRLRFPATIGVFCMAAGVFLVIGWGLR